MSGIRMVIFDLGGVVIRICRDWREACGRAGVPVREPERFAEFAGERRALVDRYQSGRMATDEYWPRIAAATGGLYQPHEIEAVHRAWLIEDYDGIASVIDRLHDAEVATACLSNTNDSHYHAMLGNGGGPASPALQRLRHHLVSHELGCVKPEPAIYREAERRLGRAPAELLFFDDLPENVEAARAAGWRAETIDHASGTSEQVARHLRDHGVLGG